MNDRFLFPLSFKLGLASLALVGAGEANAGMFTDTIEEFGKARAEGKSTFALDIDNDSLLFNKNDGFYTSGIRLVRQYALRDAERLTVYGWRFGQEIYTPSDIKLQPEQISPNDHPYAGWLYGGLFRSVHRADGTHTRIGFDLGCIGPCSGAKGTQTALHRVIDQPLPQGWSRQVRNEPGVVLYADIAPVRWTPVVSLDVTPTVHGRFGNIFTDAGLGVTARAGRLNALPDQPAAYGFARIDGRVVAYDATLQGGYFSSGNPHTVQPKRWVGEAEIGVAWTGTTYGVKASVLRRSNEIRDLPDAAGAQNFVRLQFSYAP